MPIVPEQIPYVAQAEITVDARADEAAWAGALVITDLVTFNPSYGQIPAGRTTVRVLADHDGIWFHIVAQDPEPERIRAGLGRRDTRFDDDWCAIYLDPTGEAQRSYLFLVNPLGIQADGTNVSGAGEDVSWDARWSSTGRRTPEGYELEIGIPWRAVRHPAVADTMGLFVFRRVARSGEKSSWPALDPDISGLLVQEGIVGGPGALPTSAGLDVTPELTFALDEDGPDGDRLGVGGVSPGVTVRWAPSAAFQFLGTANPDFSQVESDTAQIDVNRRYALYYEEKRPFFLEGQEWFSHSFGDLVYTRSMVQPLYGVRTTAEGGGWTGSVLHLLDADPAPSVAELGGWTEDQLGDAPALETVARIRRTLGADAYVGAVFSDRTILGTPLTNRLGGFDWHAPLSERWSTSASALASVTELGAGRGATALSPAGNAELLYSSKHFSWDLEANAISPGFRAENGFVTQTDRMGAGTAMFVDTFPKSEVVPRVTLRPVSGELAWTTKGEPRLLRIDPAISADLGNGAHLYLEGAHGGEAFAGSWLERDRVYAEGTVPWARWLWTNAGVSTGTGILYDPLAPATGWQDDVWGQVTLQPFPSLSATFTGSWERFLLDGEQSYAGGVARVRIEAFASRRLWARVIAQHDGFSDTTLGEALVAWEHSPGSAFYLGASRTVGDPAPGRALAPVDAWQVFAKGTWVFSL